MRPNIRIEEFEMSQLMAKLITGILSFEGDNLDYVRALEDKKSVVLIGQLARKLSKAILDFAKTKSLDPGQVSMMASAAQGLLTCRHDNLKKAEQQAEKTGDEAKDMYYFLHSLAITLPSMRMKMRLTVNLDFLPRLHSSMRA
jgi:hypothetical protein